ncbi:MAG: tRNA pseudouridine(38-40) synthase TruA [Bacteroidota bacterium]
MRYFLELAYKGTHYFGWQIQPKDITVQGVLEQTFSTILRTPIAITGCGRTDTGVHASQYFAHFDFTGDLPQNFLYRINKFLPKDIAIRRIFPVAADAHARFDAYLRSYEYHIALEKNPFSLETAYYLPYAKKMEMAQLQAAASLLLEYDAFFPFCKTKSDAKTMLCDVQRVEWVFHESTGKLVFHISANRFLRGMVRLIVGMCLNVGSGKLSLAEVRTALEEQKRLPKDASVVATGLFLTEIRYSFLDN